MYSSTGEDGTAHMDLQWGPIKWWRSSFQFLQPVLNMLQQLIDLLYLFLQAAMNDGWVESWNTQVPKCPRIIGKQPHAMSNPLILNSVALLVALLSTTIRSVSATMNRKNHLSGTCRLFEPHRLAMWGHTFIITLAFMSCRYQLQKLTSGSYKFPVPHISFFKLFMSTMSPGHCKHEQGSVIDLFEFWPTGRRAGLFAFLSLCRGQLGFCWWKPHLHKCMHSGGLAWTKLLE